MATLTEIASLRKITNGAEGYTDQQLSDLLDGGATEQQLAYRIWNELAASYATLVDVSESGSSRSLSELHKNALNIAAVYSPSAASEVAVKPRTRKMVRG
jgi:hypothetical protein